MTAAKAPRGEIEWSRRAILNVVDVLAESAFDTFVDPAAIDRVFGLWRAALRT